MTSIELIPVDPRASQRLADAVSRYEAGVSSLQAIRDLAVEIYGDRAALIALVIELDGLSRWQAADLDVEALRAAYRGPTIPGLDLSLAHALCVKFALAWPDHWSASE